MLRCAVCAKVFHYGCLELTEKSFEKISELGLQQWCCTDCKGCIICNDGGGENQLLLCDICDRGYHTFCLDPPLARPPAGRWLCNDCVICESCGARKPGREGSGARWNEDYTLCRACSKLIKDGKFCPICNKDKETPMIQCDGCSRWVHAACENLTTEQYEELSAQVDFEYYCPTCKNENKQSDNTAQDTAAPSTETNNKNEEDEEEVDIMEQ